MDVDGFSTDGRFLPWQADDGTEESSRDMPETYYDRLGVTADASTADIERAYRERLKDTHPDVSDDPDAAERTKDLIEAKEVLTDERERSRYDRLGHHDYENYHGSFVEADQEDVAETGPEEDWGQSGPGWGESGDGSGTSETADESWGQSGTRDRAQRRAQNRETRAEWNTAADGRTGADGATHAREWRAWDTDAPYRVYRTDQSRLGSRLFPPGPSLLLLATAFGFYPVMLWAAIEPAFPLAVNLVVVVCLVLVVGFLQSMPEVGVVVFGAWTVLLPVVLAAGLGVDLLSFVGAVAIAGTVLPLGLSVLTFVALRA